MKIIILISCTSLALISVFSDGAVASPVSLIGGTPDGVIYDIDPLTGLASNPRDTGIDHLVGLAFSQTGTLYGWSSFMGAPARGFYVIDSSDGGATYTGSTSASFADGEFAPTGSVSLLHASVAGSPGGSPALLRIDATSLFVQYLAVLSVQNAAIAIDRRGDLFAVGEAIPTGNTVVIHFDEPGHVLQQWSLDRDLGQIGTTFAANGILFIADGGIRGTGDLRSFDPDSGLLQVIGNTGVSGGLTSLAYIPEPTTLMLLVAGAVTVFTMKHRLHPTGALSREQA